MGCGSSFCDSVGDSALSDMLATTTGLVLVSTYQNYGHDSPRTLAVDWLSQTWIKQ